MSATGHRHSKLAWCATFAHLIAFETKGDIKAAMRIASPAYERDGELPPGRAVQLWLHSALTWPGTDPFEACGDTWPAEPAEVTKIIRLGREAPTS